ncbi:MAG TPA: hypothetical protein VMC48_03035 [Methanobacterium sp.]|nr:hypothetical protein [Methanobacterium sp.]
METTIKTIQQDLNVARQYFRQKDFELMGRMGDRIMSNLLLGEAKDLMIIGYLVKEVSEEFISIKEVDPVRLNGCMDAGDKFLRDLTNSLSDENHPVMIWEHYSYYKTKIVEFVPTDVELAVYQKESDFTAQITSKLMKILDENRTLLLDNYNNLLQSILDEQRRVINIYGFSKIDLILYITLKAFNEYYLYLLAYKMANQLKGEAISSKIYHYVDEISNLPLEFQEISSKSNELLGELGYKTRKFSMENVDPRETIKSLRGF